MRRPPTAARRTRRFGAPKGPIAAAVALAVLAACSGVEDSGANGLGVHGFGASEPAAPGRLARIHVVLRPPGEAAEDTPGDEPALDIVARFVQYRGLDEAAVRARADLLPLASDRLREGQCVPSEQLWVAAEEPRDTSGRDTPRELVLVDAGNIAVQIGEASVDVPLSLVPDLLPYMSGVEYGHVSEALPARAWAAGEPAPAALTITVDGDDELPGFVVRAPIPEPVVFQATPSPDRSSLLLEWRPDGRGQPVLVRLSTLIGSESAGDEITCRLSDAGSQRLDLDDLRSLGLDLSGDTLQLGASRLARVRFDAADLFTRDNAEAVVEVRSSALVVWP
jgi:hypothetical protein